jgi:hypothetical protein
VLRVAGNPPGITPCPDRRRRAAKTILDGYNLMPFFKGEVQESPRKEFLYWSDDGDLFALRYDRWKIVFIEQNGDGTSRQLDVKRPTLSCTACRPLSVGGLPTNRQSGLLPCSRQLGSRRGRPAHRVIRGSAVLGV